MIGDVKSFKLKKKEKKSCWQSQDCFHWRMSLSSCYTATTCWKRLTLVKVNVMITVLDSSFSSLLLTPHDPLTLIPVGFKFISSYFYARWKGRQMNTDFTSSAAVKQHSNIKKGLFMYIRLLAWPRVAGQIWPTDTLSRLRHTWGCNFRRWEEGVLGSGWWWQVGKQK